MITEIYQKHKLYLKWVNKDVGWGVFTDSFIKKGDIVEICYCLIDNQISAPHKNYTFQINDNPYDVYHVLGFGAIYNHSSSPNIRWESLPEEGQIVIFYASRDIEIGEELRHDYGTEYWEKRGRKPLI